MRLHERTSTDDNLSRGSRATHPWFVWLALTVGVIGVSFSSIIIKKSTSAPAAIAAYRLALTVLLLVGPACAIEGLHRLPFRRRDVMKALLSGMFLAVHFLSWITSLSYTSVASSVLLVSCHTLFIVLYARMTTGRNFDRKAIAGILAAMVGTGVIGAQGWKAGRLELFGDALALLGAVAMAGYCLVGGDVRQRVGVLSYATMVYGTASVLLFGTCLLSGVPLWPYPSTEWRIFWSLAVIPTVFGHTIFNWALRYVPAWVVSASTLGEPVGAAVLAFALLKETPSPAVLAGGVMVVGGLYVFLRYDRPV